MENTSTTSQALDKLTNELKVFAQLLLDNEYTIIIYNSTDERKLTWFHFSKNDKIAYIQVNIYNMGFDFSLPHLPNHRTGSGMSVIQNVYDLDLNIAESVVNTYAPEWATRLDLESIKKYKNVDDFISKKGILNYIVLKK